MAGLEADAGLPPGEARPRAGAEGAARDLAQFVGRHAALAVFDDHGQQRHCIKKKHTHIP